MIIFSRHKTGFILLAAAVLFFTMTSCTSSKDNDTEEQIMEKTPQTGTSEERALATFGGGCFWCTEAVFERIPGVLSVVSGYEGGETENPTYREVSRGDTGHAEVIQIEYDPAVVSYEELLELFWKAHDPTTLNRQGADVGTQYRSIILYHDEEQKIKAEASKRKAGEKFSDPIVTEIKPHDTFYPAEDYHQDYFDNNPNAGYCRVVIQPKLKKLDLDFQAR